MTKEKQLPEPIRRFLNRLTVTDAMNLIAFGAGSYATYKGITGLADITEIIPDWLKIISPLSPFLYQIVIPSEAAKKLTEVDKISLALLGGYSTVKLVPRLAEISTEALQAAVMM